jgi:5-keto 4-deoxyuronate isomerase
VLGIVVVLAHVVHVVLRIQEVRHLGEHEGVGIHSMLSPHWVVSLHEGVFISGFLLVWLVCSFSLRITVPIAVFWLETLLP